MAAEWTQGQAAQAAHAPAPGTVPQQAPAAPSVQQGDPSVQHGSHQGGVRAPEDDLRLEHGQVERVLRRALELQDAAHRPTTREALSWADLQDIGEQLGLDASLLRRAVTDVRLADAVRPHPAPAQRFLGPIRIAGATVVRGDPTTVHAAVGEWMADDEGMTLGGRRGNRDRWVKDRRWLVGLRRTLHVDRGSGVLRDLPAVEVGIEPTSDGTIVTLDADTRPIRTTSGAVVAAGLVGGTALGAAAAGMIGGPALGGDAGQFALTFAANAALGAGSGVLIARRWAAKVRDAVDAALDGITLTATQQDRPPSRRSRLAWWQVAGRWLGLRR